VSARDGHADHDHESATRVRVLVFVVASVIAYAGLWLIGSMLGRMLLGALTRSGLGLSWYGPIIWTLCAVLIGAVQAGALWVCGVRSPRSLVLRTLASVALTAALFVLIDLLAQLLSSEMVSLSFRIISAAAGPVLAIGVAGTAVLVSLIPQRAVEQAHQPDAVSAS